MKQHVFKINTPKRVNKVLSSIHKQQLNIYPSVTYRARHFYRVLVLLITTTKKKLLRLLNATLHEKHLYLRYLSDVA
jgi:hypothetical protein